jgi:hypothetical protein
MIFEPTINLGNLVMIAMIVVTVIGGWYKFGGRLDIIEFRVKAIEETLKTLSEVLRSIADTDKQLALIDQRQLTIETTVSTMGREIADLRRGGGWITAQRASVDGEYTR